MSGRTRTYFMLSAPKMIMASMARVSAFKFIASWAPAADVLALSTSECDISKLASGDICTCIIIIVFIIIIIIIIIILLLLLLLLLLLSLWKTTWEKTKCWFMLTNCFSLMPTVILIISFSITIGVVKCSSLIPVFSSYVCDFRSDCEMER